MPGGLISFVSDVFGGATSDRQICERSNLVNKVESGDSTMANNGFNVQDMFIDPNVEINIPEFFRKKTRLSEKSVLKDRKIASKRVHVEREKQRCGPPRLQATSPSERYQELKDAITAAYGKKPLQCHKELLNIRLDGRRPSELLRHMQRLNQAAISYQRTEEALVHQFRNLMPPLVVMLLKTLSNRTLKEYGMAADSFMDDHMEQEGRCPVNNIPAVNTTSTTPQQSPIQPRATQPDNSMAEILQALKENTQEIRGIIQQCVTQPQGQSLPLPPPPQYQPPPQDRRPHPKATHIWYITHRHTPSGHALSRATIPAVTLAAIHAAPPLDYAYIAQE
ncbi:hypothetical protein Pmani_012044 [Petrolisthes manimaculis]|uniref:DDE Tnp4 domain-containing protein n=1 Tax=Petrolisthes manimaculis TaxID=1843537 RepID=A0AAE1PZZ9_9EUCA|nr:hypothetical protein Pmani_012044 [Petrolisthes manimaculis]